MILQCFSLRTVVCSGQKNPLYAVVQGVAEGMRADTRSGRTKAIAAFLCPSAESEPSLVEVSSLRFSLLLLFHTSSFQVVIIRFRWCVDAKICGMFVCEIKPIVWQIFFEISAKTMDSIPYRNYVYCYYPYVCLKVENYPALLTVSSMVFLSPRSTNTTEEQPDGKNVQLPYLYKGSVQKSRFFWHFGLCVTAHSDDGTHGRNFQHRRFSK